MNSNEMIDVILKYHIMKRKKEKHTVGGFFDYHFMPKSDWVGCDPKCGKMLKDLEYQKLKEVMQEP